MQSWPHVAEGALRPPSLTARCARLTLSASRLPLVRSGSLPSMRIFAFSRMTSGNPPLRHEAERPKPRKRAQAAGALLFATTGRLLRGGTRPTPSKRNDTGRRGLAVSLSLQCRLISRPSATSGSRATSSAPRRRPVPFLGRPSFPWGPSKPSAPSFPRRSSERLRSRRRA